MKKESFATGVSFTLLSAVGMSLVGLLGKLGTYELALEALIFWRYLAAFFLCFGFLWLMGKLHGIFRFTNPKLHFLRAFFVLGAQYSFYYYIRQDTLLNGIVLLNLGPLFIPLIERIVLDRKIGKSTWVGLIISCAGMLCILQPGTGIFSLLSCVGVFSGLSMGCSQVVFGISSQKERSDLSVLYLFFLCMTISLIPYLFVENRGSPETGEMMPMLLLVLGLGAASLLNQMCRAIAYTHGTPSRLAAFLYFAIPLGGGFDWAVFGKVPNALSWVGALLVIVGGMSKIYLRRLILKGR